MSDVQIMQLHEAFSRLDRTLDPARGAPNMRQVFDDLTTVVNLHGDMTAALVGSNRSMANAGVSFMRMRGRFDEIGRAAAGLQMALRNESPDVPEAEQLLATELANFSPSARSMAGAFGHSRPESFRLVVDRLSQTMATRAASHSVAPERVGELPTGSVSDGTER